MFHPRIAGHIATQLVELDHRIDKLNLKGIKVTNESGAESTG